MDILLPKGSAMGILYSKTSELATASHSFLFTDRTDHAMIILLMQPTEGKARIGEFVEDSMISHR
jgi:hypothetical protein